MKRVANENNFFADYQALLSGSTREDVRVRNTYEVDYLTQYDVEVTKIIEVHLILGMFGFDLTKRTVWDLNQLWNKNS